MDHSTHNLTQRDAVSSYQYENMSLSNYSNEFNLTQDEIAILYQYENETLIYRIYLEIFTILAIICIAANILIAYVIIKYKKLRKDKSNIILVNWAILNIFFMISSPATLRMALDLSIWTSFSDKLYCFVEQLEYTALLANMMLMVLLTMYWYLKLYNNNIFEKYMRNFNFFLGSVYIISLFCISLHWDACYNGRNYNLSPSEAFLVLFYLIFILFMIVVNVLHFFKKRRVTGNTRNVPFILSNTFFLTILPSLLAAFPGMFFKLETVTIVAMLSVTLLISLMNPIYFFIILYKCDKDYNTFLKHVLSCRCKQYNNEELMEQPVVYNSEARYAENTC